MAVIKPFKALRPRREIAEKVAALPYDVMNTEEAREMAAGNAYSFLHVSRPEIDLPADADPHSEPVYAQGKENLQELHPQRRPGSRIRSRMLLHLSPKDGCRSLRPGWWCARP